MGGFKPFPIALYMQFVGICDFLISTVENIINKPIFVISGD